MTFSDRQQLQQELQVLCEAVMHSDITEEQMRTLSDMIRNDRSLRTYYVRYMRQNSMLLQRRGISSLPRIDQLRIGKRISSPKVIGYRPVLISAIVLVIVAISGLFLIKDHIGRFFSIALHQEKKVSETSPQDDASAVMFGTFRMTSSHLVWGDTESTIEHNAQVGRCVIHLVEGTAQVDYDNGVCLKIEGPTKIELSRFDRCFLFSGNVLAQVSPKGVGFTIDTYSARIEDHGTEFGVYVQDENNASVRVFQGHVEVTPAGDGTSIPLTTGRLIRFSDTDDNPSTQASSQSQGEEFVRTTADGRGKDSIVISNKTNKGLESIGDGKYHKVYFTIDLSDLPVYTFSDAVLELTFARPETVPESHPSSSLLFSIYGLSDESGDSWDVDHIDWKTAPANKSGAAGINLDQAMMIGQIELLTSEITCVKRVSGSALRRFIELDTNNLLTFIIVCENDKSEDGVYAYDITGHKSPGSNPPTLRLFTLKNTDNSGDESAVRKE